MDLRSSPLERITGIGSGSGAVSCRAELMLLRMEEPEMEAWPDMVRRWPCDPEGAGDMGCEAEVEVDWPMLVLM